MAGSSFGRLFRISTWGESHGKAVGVVVDGCPAGLPLTEADIQACLDMRKPGQSSVTTQRKESDTVEILSGTFEGLTTGTPISMIVRNTSARSGDYSEIAHCYRPGHADYTFDMKYGFRDYRGGGRSSARETIGRVAGGAVALKILEACGISVTAYTSAIGPVCVDKAAFDAAEIFRNPVYMPDKAAAEAAMALILDCREKQDSVGGVIECLISHVPAGLGEPVFDKLSADLAKAICSIGAVKGFEIGDGTLAAKAFGSQNNDPFAIDEDGSVIKKTNHSGGLLGGISDGSDIILRAHVKPTPSIFREQQTVSDDGRPVTLSIKGRHDPVVVPRAVIVVKCMAALVIADALMANMTARMDYLTDFYRK